MNKSMLSAALIAALSAGAAHAEQENTGCGLGSMVFDGKQGVAPQVLAVTTNGTFGNQTFGITSGTLGCTQDGVVKSYAQLEMFTGSNLAGLAGDMAVGQGENLESLANLMGVEPQDKAQFFQATKENFTRIFTSEDITAGEMLANLNAVLASDETLNRYVVLA